MQRRGCAEARAILGDSGIGRIALGVVAQDERAARVRPPEDPRAIQAKLIQCTHILENRPATASGGATFMCAFSSLIPSTCFIACLLFAWTNFHVSFAIAAPTHTNEKEKA